MRLQGQCGHFDHGCSERFEPDIEVQDITTSKQEAARESHAALSVASLPACLVSCLASVVGHRGNRSRILVNTTILKILSNPSLSTSKSRHVAAASQGVSMEVDLSHHAYTRPRAVAKPQSRSHQLYPHDILNNRLLSTHSYAGSAGSVMLMARMQLTFMQVSLLNVMLVQGASQDTHLCAA